LHDSTIALAHDAQTLGNTPEEDDLDDGHHQQRPYQASGQRQENHRERAHAVQLPQLERKQRQHDDRDNRPDHIDGQELQDHLLACAS
jgi:hypothetical protein